MSAVMIAQVFGPLLGILGLWMLLYGENVVKIMTSMKNTPSVHYLASVYNLLIGLFIISSYNIWSWDMLFFVTLLGWVLFIRAVFGLFVPQLMVRLFMSNVSWMKSMGIIPFVWGLILIWAGFYS